MVFLQRTNPSNPRKRPNPTPEPHPLSNPNPNPNPNHNPNPNPSNGRNGEDPHTATTISVLAAAGCTLRIDGPPSLPSDPHRLRRHLESRFATDPSLLADFLSGLTGYIRSPHNLKRLLVPASTDRGDSLFRSLLLVPALQPLLLRALLELLPEHFVSPALSSASLNDDIARLIVVQFRWLDFLVDPEGFSEKLMEVLSISPLRLKKEIIGSLPEIVGDGSHAAVVSALERMLQEDSEVIVPVLDSFSNLNLDDQLQEQAVTIALSCIRTVDVEHMPHLLRFLLLSATSANVRRIIGQIREQLKFVGSSDPRVARNKKLKGKSVADTTEASILDALRSSLRFKNILCEAILKELKSLDQPRDHKVIDVWFLILIYKNGGSMQKAAEKILKKKVVDGCFREFLFDQCIHGQRELVRDYFPSFLSVCECLLACKEKQARDFGIYLYKSMFEEFSDTYSRQELLGTLVTHIGSGIGHEVSSALEAMALLTSTYAEELLPVSFCINGILDYLEGYHEENLHKVYEVFCNLALCARSGTKSTSSSIANELLMIIRKQISNSDMNYRKMGIIGTMKIVSTLGNINAAATCLSSQKTNCQEALEVLKLSLDSCKSATLLLILLYDELIALLESNTIESTIIGWIGKHVSDFESSFLSDLDGGKLSMKDSSNDLEGELWMNLDGDISPICLNILPLHLSSWQQCSSSLQILPSQFLLLSTIERLTNQGSLGGIDALLGCPLHLPSPKYFGSDWKKLTEKQKQALCTSLYYAINWLRELLNAFSTQVDGRIDCITQATRNETMTKLLKRLRNLLFMESLLNTSLKHYPLSLPELQYSVEHLGSSLVSNTNNSIEREKQSSERHVSQETYQTNRRVKKGKVASEKSNPSEKLRQPTIMDTLKKAGVISQEVAPEGSPAHSSHGKIPQCIDDQDKSNKAGPVDISAEFTFLYAQRSKFRPLRVDCLLLLSFSESHQSCCSDPAAELPLHLYLLRDFHNKLDYLNPPSKPFLAAASVKASTRYCGMTTCKFLKKIRPLFPSLKKHLDAALNILRNGQETCENHWKFESSSAGNPDIPHLVVSEASVARSVFREVLCCYNKILCLPDLFLQTNLPILRDLLDAFQPNGGLEHFFSGLQPMPSAGNIDYLYCGVYSLLEGFLGTAYTFSFLLASEVLVTLQSVVNSIVMLIEKSTEANGKNKHVGCFQKTLPFLRSRLGLSAHKLLVHNSESEDNDGWKNKGDTIQKILQIYLKNSESTSDLLDELACSVLPQVPSCKSKNTQEAAHDFQTLCPTMFLTWCRVLHEENILVLNKLVKGVTFKSRANIQRESVKDVLIKLRQSVNIVVSLVNMCKVHDKVAVHAMAVKYGGKFVDTFLKVFDFLQAHFDSHNEDIIQLVKELQKATRIVQTLCSEAKGSKRTMVTSKIPATKRSMERFLFHVKALLHNTSNGRTFWMGNLKHKDLFGQVVSSQVYVNQEEEPHVEEVDLDESLDDCGEEDEQD